MSIGNSICIHKYIHILHDSSIHLYAVHAVCGECNDMLCGESSCEPPGEASFMVCGWVGRLVLCCVGGWGN
jgi:hypothetical protein